MQIIEPPKVINENEVHLIDTYLIGTKPTQEQGDQWWQVPKSILSKIVHKFQNHDFAIIPELLTSGPGMGGHYWGSDTLPDLLQGYSNHSHGKITKIKGPFSYNDGTDDYYYRANVKLSGSKAASTLLEHGAKTLNPFSVSCHLWPLSYQDQGQHIITDFDAVGLSLVTKGAHGPSAVVNKYCKGATSVCERSLAASVLCPKEDEMLTDIINSHISKAASFNIMSANETQNQVNTNSTNLGAFREPIGQNLLLPQTQEQPTKKEETITLTKEEYEAIKSKEENEKLLQAQVTELLNENKTNLLNQIFAEVEEEKDRQTLFDKYFKGQYNIKQLNEFFGDVVSYILPSKIKKAQDEAVEQANKESNTEVKKSKGASILKPEPKREKEETESKAASIVTKVDELGILRDELGLTR